MDNSLREFFDQRIKWYLNKVKSDPQKSEYVNDWAVLAVCLEYTEEKSFELSKVLTDKYKVDISPDKLLGKLRHDRLYKHSGRRETLAECKEMSNQMNKLLSGNEKAFDWIDNFVEKTYKQKGSCIIPYKAALVWMFLFDERYKSSDGVIFVKLCGEGYCSSFIKDVLNYVGNQIGKKRKRNIKQVLDESKDIFNVKLSTQQTNLSSDKDKQIETLKFDLNNYKNALETIQAMFEDLKDGVEVAANEAKEVAVTEFFAKMNSSEYGNLLDNLINVEKSLKECRKQKIALPPKLMPLSIIFSQLIKFVRDSKITSIDSAGREFETDYEGIDGFIYSGTEFVTEDEKKSVVVTSPGWKYEDMVISVPTLKEKSDV